MADTVSATGSFWKTNASNILLGLGCLGIVGVAIGMGFLTRDKDKAEEITTKLSVICGVVVFLCILFAIAAYIYFSSYPAYLTNFVLVMTFVNLALSMFAVSAATVRF
jgi:hypothetical protein